MTAVIFVLFSLAFLALVGLVISTIIRTSRNPVATQDNDGTGHSENDPN
jgi:hypothetical protein